MGVRIARHAIPRVNPNPRPPNEPRPNTGGTQAPKFRNNNTTGLGGQQTARASHPGVGSNKAVEGPPRPAPSATATAAPSPPPAAALAPPIDPRDSQYWKDYASLKFENDLAMKQLDTEDVFAKSAFDREKAARDYQAPLEVNDLRQGANVGGRIYSTGTQEKLGNLAQEQFGRNTSALEAYQAALNERSTKRGELKSGYERALHELLEGATERGSEGEINRPALEDVFENPAVAALVARASGKKPGKGKGSNKKSGGVTRNSPINAKTPKNAGKTGKGGGTTAPAPRSAKGSGGTSAPKKKGKR